MVKWKDPPNKLMLSARNSRMFGPSRKVYIPPARCRFSVLPSPPEQGVIAEKPGPSKTPPCPCPKEVEVKVKVQKESTEGTAKNKNNLVPNSEQNDQDSPDKRGDLPLIPRPLKTKSILTSHKCSPGTLDLNPKHPQNSLSGKAQVSPMGSSEGWVVTNPYSPLGDVLPPLRPNSEG